MEIKIAEKLQEDLQESWLFNSSLLMSDASYIRRSKSFTSYGLLLSRSDNKFIIDDSLESEYAEFLDMFMPELMSIYNSLKKKARMSKVIYIK